MEEPTYFFSYAREDSEVILKLATGLRAVGAKLWLDQLDIFAGQRWDRAVEDALVTCQGMIVVLSPASVASQNVMDEVSYALEEGKLVVPILLRSCAIPFRLRRVQYVDLTASYETGFSQLLRALRLDQPLHPVQPAAPQEPPVREVEGVSRPAVEPERGEEQSQRRIAALYSEAQAAMAAEDWAIAMEKWQALLALNPAHADASAQLRAAQQQRELDLLYTTGQQHYEAGRWHEALDYFRQVQERQSHYKDVRARIDAAQREMVRAETTLAAPLRPANISSEAPHTPLSGGRKRMWMIGGLALLAVLIGVLIELNRPGNREDPPHVSPAVVTPPAKADKTQGPPAADAKEQYSKGVQHYAVQDYVEAAMWYRKAADQGHAGAQNSLGVIYEKGQGVAKDDAEAVQWYRKAAAQGDAEAQAELGRRYARGQKVTKDPAEAAGWVRQAADQGDADAQTNLGWMYATGRGVAQDYAEVVKWYRQAADQGDAGAQTNLGLMYDNGQGVAKDEAEAVKWYRKAADQGFVWAQTNLGRRYDNGQGVAKDEAEAVKWYRKAADQGDAEAQYELGRRYANGQGVAKDEAEAVKWYRKAADRKTAAGTLMLNIDVGDIDLGHAKAQYELGEMYANGRGVPKDEAQAITWYRRAAAQGHAEAQYQLGERYANGKGVAKDRAEAVTWYRKAAAQGNVNAQNALRRLGLR